MAPIDVTLVAYAEKWVAPQRSSDRVPGTVSQQLPDSEGMEMDRSISVAVAALFVITGCSAGRGSGSGAVASPTSTPTPTTRPIDSLSRATPSASFEVIGERIAAGTHTATPWASPNAWAACAGQAGCTESTADDSISIMFTVPDGWALAEDVAVTKPAAGTVAPSGMSLHFLRGGWLFSDPCLKVDTLPDIEVGPTADDFANALAAHPLLETTTPVDVTLGGFSGKYLDLQVPSDISACPESDFPWAPAFYAQGPNHRWHVWSLNVNAVRVVIQSGDFAGTSQQDLGEMHAIIESIHISP